MMKSQFFAGGRMNVSVAATTAVLALSLSTPALSFEADPTERDKLRTCERSLCEIILTGTTTGDALSCPLQKTWVNDEISGGFGAKGLDWAFGDARCTVNLELPQDMIVKAVKEASYTLAMPKHPVSCELKSADEVTPVSFNLAPSVDFESGKATSATLNISDVEGDSVIATAIGGVGTLETWTGLFKGEIAEEVNEFIGQKCAKRYPEFAAQ